MASPTLVPPVFDFGLGADDPAADDLFSAFTKAEAAFATVAAILALKADAASLTAGQLTDVAVALKAVIMAADLPGARAALGLGNVANLAPADLPVSLATATAIAALAGQVSANATTVATLLAGANPAVDTFIEVYNRFLSDESAAAATLSALSALQLALAAEVTRAQGVEAANGTAIAAEVTRAKAAEALLAPLASPAFGGVPTAPTPAAGDATAKLATTAFVLGQAATASPVMDGVAAVGVSGLYARQDHVHPADTSRVPVGRQVATAAAGGLAGGGGLGVDLSLALASIPALTLLANPGAVAAVPAGTSLSALLDAVIGSSRGAMLVRGAGSWAALALGTSGYVLQSNGTDLVYAAVSPGSGAVRYDVAQTLTLGQQLLERQNTGVRGAGVLAKSAAYTVAAADAGRLFACSGTFALTLPSAAAVGAGFAIEVSNAGTGKITLTPNGVDTIGGLSSLVVNRREGGVLQSDGANWQAVGFAAVVVAQSLGATGYRQWSDGAIEQWGTYTGGAQDPTITFPVAFTTASPTVVANIVRAPGNEVDVVIINNVGAASFVGQQRYGYSGGYGASPYNFTWYARGY